VGFLLWVAKGILALGFNPRWDPRVIGSLAFLFTSFLDFGGTSDLNSAIFSNGFPRERVVD